MSTQPNTPQTNTANEDIPVIPPIVLLGIALVSFVIALFVGFTQPEFGAVGFGAIGIGIAFHKQCFGHQIGIRLAGRARAHRRQPHPERRPGNVPHLAGSPQRPAAGQQLRRDRPGLNGESRHERSVLDAGMAQTPRRAL